MLERVGLALVAWFVFNQCVGCREPKHNRSRGGTDTTVAVSNEPLPPSVAPSGSVQNRARAWEGFVDLRQRAEEQDAVVLADNVISNELHFLSIDQEIERQSPPSAAYIGVGPEQNFSYISLVRPSIAMIVDNRRDNAGVHLLHKAAFELANGRTEYLALLLGRTFTAGAEPAASSSVVEVLRVFDSLPTTRTSFDQNLDRIMRFLHEKLGPLELRDREAIERAARTLWGRQLDGRPAVMGSANGQEPSLREILLAPGSEGAAHGYLSTDDQFRIVQRLQQQDRIIPLVGDFAGEKTLVALSSWLRENRHEVGVFYTSNVEQFLDQRAWERWQKNARRLPFAPQARVIRSFLDSGEGGSNAPGALDSFLHPVDSLLSEPHPSHKSLRRWISESKPKTLR